ncbi:hypothetical protein MKY48_32015 [Paenibacillus sp. FSL W8-0187]|uniref:hypothetical protein n=1 Tax=Paenibacillus sp. FSL W8-0187 TaxID=2921710 RepID=UPI0030DD4886
MTRTPRSWKLFIGLMLILLFSIPHEVSFIQGAHWIFVRCYIDAAFFAAARFHPAGCSGIPAEGPCGCAEDKDREARKNHEGHPDARDIALRKTAMDMPFGPMIASTSPSRISRATSCTTVR